MPETGFYFYKMSIQIYYLGLTKILENVKQSYSYISVTVDGKKLIVISNKKKCMSISKLKTLTKLETNNEKHHHIGT